MFHAANIWIYSNKVRFWALFCYRIPKRDGAYANNQATCCIQHEGRVAPRLQEGEAFLRKRRERGETAAEACCQEEHEPRIRGRAAPHATPQQAY